MDRDDPTLVALLAEHRLDPKAEHSDPASLFMFRRRQDAPFHVVWQCRSSHAYFSKKGAPDVLTNPDDIQTAVSAKDLVSQDASISEDTGTVAAASSEDAGTVAAASSAASEKRKQQLPLASVCHAYFSLEEDSDGVMHAVGLLHHDDTCTSMRAKEHGVTFANIRLHPAIAEQLRAAVLQDLKTGHILRANRKQLQELNADGFEELDGVIHRVALNPSDVKTARRAAQKAEGLDLRLDPYENLHAMIKDKSKDDFKAIRNAVIFYKPRDEAHLPSDANGDEDKDRLEMVIATQDMLQRARDFAHGKMLFMDGTFGISTAKLLVFVVLALDPITRMGIPVAFLIFSASSYARSTASSYSASLLTRLLRKWKEKVGETFLPSVAMTDTDHRERLALSSVFPGIRLLLCRFHLRQCWTNNRKTKVGVKSQWYQTIANLENTMIGASASEAKRLLADTKKALQETGEEDFYAKKALSHVDYLNTHWLSDNIIHSWTRDGFVAAAAALNIGVDDVPATNNISESFANLLKHSELEPFMHGGRRMRLDLLIKSLVANIMPLLLFRRQLQASMYERKARVRNVAAILQGSPHAVVAPDNSRDRQAALLLDHVGDIQISQDRTKWVACRSDDGDRVYTVQLHPTLSCSCLDQVARKRGCKHIRAALLKHGVHHTCVTICSYLIIML